MASDSKSPRGLPNWLSLLILLLVLAGGCWGVWRWFEGGSSALPTSAAVALTDANVDGPALPRQRMPRPPNFGQFAARFTANMPDGIMATGNAYLVKSGITRLDIDGGNGRGNGRGNGPGNGRNDREDWRYRFSYAIPDVESPAEMTTLQAANRVRNDPAAAQKLGVTDAQIQQLRQLRAAGMVVSPADRAKISTLFHAWLVATGRPASPSTQPIGLPAPSAQSKSAQDQLLAALADIGNRELGPTRQSYSDRASRISTILGDGLLQKLKSP
jgi:hypothetical protein